MDLGPARSRQSVTDYVGDYRVSTAVHTAFLHYQAAIHERVSHSRRMKSRDAMHVREDIGPATQTRNRDRDQDLREFLRQAIHPLRDHIVHSSRDRELPAELQPGIRRRSPLPRLFVNGEKPLGKHGFEKLDDVKRISSSHAKDPAGESPCPGGGAHVTHLAYHAPELLLREWAKGHNIG